MSVGPVNVRLWFPMVHPAGCPSRQFHRARDRTVRKDGLPVGYGGTAQDGLWRVDKVVQPNINSAPHNAHVGSYVDCWATDGPGVRQEHGPHLWALRGDAGVVRTLALRAYQLERSPFRIGRGIFLSGGRARSRIAGS